MLDLIYCAGNNSKLVDIAHEEGWLLGLRSDASIHRPPVFVDIDYKKPHFEKHLEMVVRYRPKYATVPDLSDTQVSVQDIERALQQVERLKPYCDIPLIVPKLSGQIALLPEDIAVGYSVPSSYGGAQYPLWELAGRRVYLLGGSPRKQQQTYLHLSAIADVMSVDGNYAQRQAVKFAMYWSGKAWLYHPEKASNGRDLYLECFRWSCQSILKEWQSLVGSCCQDYVIAMIQSTREKYLVDN